MSKAYITRSGSYARSDVENDTVDPGYPKPLTGGFQHLAGTGFEHGIDAALDVGRGRVYLFRGESYLRVDHETNAVDHRDTIANGWPGLAAAGFGDALDAAVYDGRGTAYFLRGPSYLTYDVGQDAVVAGPAPIADGWPGLAEAGFGDGVDAAVDWGTGRVYFFRGQEYVRFDLAAGVVDQGPTPIAGNWPGLVPPFDGVDAVWRKLDTAPRAPLEPGDHVWWWNGRTSAARDIPRDWWFPGSTGPTDYQGHGEEIWQYVVHADGSILRGRPHMRGFAGSQAWLNHNPGNITGRPGGPDYGQYPGKLNWHGFLIFPSRDLGFAAIGTLLRGDAYRDLSLLDAFERYAPAQDGNDPVRYATDVAAAAGVDVASTIGSLSDEKLVLVQQKIEAIEGTIPGDTLDATSPDLPDELRVLLG